MKKKVEKDSLQSEAEREKDIYSKAAKVQKKKDSESTGGRIIMSQPTHTRDDLDVKIINPDAKFKDKIYQVKGSRKEFRQFDGGYHRHCGGCPFLEGCIMCTLK